MILDKLQELLRSQGINSVIVQDVDGRPRRLVTEYGDRVHLHTDGDITLDKGQKTPIAYDLILQWLEKHPERDPLTVPVQPESEFSPGPRLTLHVYLPDAEPDVELDRLENIRTSIGNFLEEFGFSPDPAAHYVKGLGSWLWREWFKPSKPIQKEMADVYDEMREALRREFLDKSGAEAFEKRAAATASVVESLAPFEKAIVRLGDVVIAKAVVDGQPQLIVESVSPAIARGLENEPGLLRDPEGFIRFAHSQAPVVEHKDTPVAPPAALPPATHTPSPAGKDEGITK